MLRYRLDDLGWVEFERLMLALLKEKHGVNVRGTRSSKDRGRDVYCASALRFPDDVKRPGPFLFQCKFVDAANAAGARPWSRVKAAVDAECTEIRARVARQVWTEVPVFYTLLTNAPLGEEHRDAVEAKLKAVLPDCEVLCQDGGDICAQLDASVSRVARAFPQLLGLCDLRDLIGRSVQAEIYRRSEVALEEATRIATVFVETQCYRRALNVLEEHAFVVLAGPPEMGKTAIGRMLAAAQVAAGWEALEVRSPNELLKAYAADRSQIFVADDFFGRTEYRPELTSMWESDLPYVVRKLDTSHWLVLTSRAHLLRMATARIDPARPAQTFPDPGELIVDASALSVAEKGRMLYRHAKLHGTSGRVRRAVRARYKDIVKNPHFTPERIRRLVSEVLPNIAVDASDEELSKCIDDSLSHPTRGMKRSFRALSPSHRWLLFAMLDVKAPAKEELARAYDRVCPADVQGQFGDVCNDLSGAFLRAEYSVRWVHPSYGDLVVTELALEPAARRRFLANCSTEGVLLACSSGGGASGEVSFPLLPKDQDWEYFKVKCTSLLVEGLLSVGALWDQVVAARRAGERRPTGDPARKLEQVVGGLLVHAEEIISAAPTLHELKALVEAAAVTGVEIPTARIGAAAVVREAQEAIAYIESYVTWDHAHKVDLFHDAVDYFAGLDPGNEEWSTVDAAIAQVVEALGATGSLNDYVDLDWTDESIESGILELREVVVKLGNYVSEESNERLWRDIGHLDDLFKAEAELAREERSSYLFDSDRPPGRSLPARSRAEPWRADEPSLDDIFRDL